MPQQQTETTVRELDGTELLDQLMSKPVNHRMAAVDGWLTDHADSLRAMLPEEMKQHAERFAARASFYIRSKPDLQECTPSSLVQATLKAAEYGFCLDGRMTHAVKHSTKVKKTDTTPEHWENVAVMMPDYKGLIAFARRHKLIGDAWGRNVHDGDTFELSEHNGKQDYQYQQSLEGGGKVLGTFAVVTLPGETFRVEYMPITDIHSIRDRSKSWKSGFGPWKSDAGEMNKKTVLRRILKTLTDDPGMLLLLASDDVDFGEARSDRPIAAPPTLDALRERIGMRTVYESVGAETIQAKPPTGAHAPARSVEEPEPAPKPKRARRTKAEMEEARQAAEPTPEPDQNAKHYDVWLKRISKVTPDTRDKTKKALIDDASLTDEQFATLNGLLDQQNDSTQPSDGQLFDRGAEQP